MDSSFSTELRLPWIKLFQNLHDNVHDLIWPRPRHLLVYTSYYSTTSLIWQSANLPLNCRQWSYMMTCPPDQLLVTDCGLPAVIAWQRGTRTRPEASCTSHRHITHGLNVKILLSRENMVITSQNQSYISYLPMIDVTRNADQWKVTLAWKQITKECKP